jgi:glucose-1-phosphate thymidylyltransferase
LVLAAGYATRLRPLTDTIAKPLLPVGGRPILDWLRDKVEEVPDVDGLHVVTNARYAPSFEAWARELGGVTVHDDGTTSNDDRLGAIGDIGFVLERIGLGDDLLVVAGDNLFDYSLADYVGWWRDKGVGSAVAVYDVGDFELIKQYGVVALDDDERVVEFVEKPTDPPSTLAATATYIYHRDHLPRVEQYLREGNPPDQPGNLVAWLHKREPVYGYAFSGGWYDIGNPQQLLEADNRLREREGLPTRAAYTPD